MKQNRYRLQAKGDRRAELLIYGDIGENWDADQSNDAKTVVLELQILKDVPLDVRINSIGGSVADGISIHNALSRYKGPVDTHVDGVAYSIASLIAQAGDTRYMAENAMEMVHAPWGMSAGNAVEMREMAEFLDKTAETMIGAYVREGGPDRDTVSEWLKSGKDNYFTAAQAKEAGLIDEISGRIDIAAALRQLPKNLPAAAGVTEELNVDPKPNNGGTPAEPSEPDFMQTHAKAVSAGQQQGAQSENARQRKIYAAFDGFVHADDPTDVMFALREQCLSDIQVDELEVNRRIMSLLKQQTDTPIQAGLATAQPDNGGAFTRSTLSREQRIAPGPDAHDNFVKGAALAIGIRSGMEKDRKVIAAERNSEFLSMDLVDICRSSLSMNHMQTGGSREDIVRRVLAASPNQGTDHFPAILENVAEKSVMDGYMEAEETWQKWTQPGTLRDYRQASRVNKSLFDKLDKMEEFEAFKNGRFADVKQSITGYLHGKRFALTLQAIVNDDLGILSEDARAWGEAANVTIGDAVWLVVSTAGTGGFGQTMDEDSTILFHSNHSNYIASGSGAAPSEDTIQVGRTAMMTQTDPNNRTIASRPRYLLHGTTLTPAVVKLLGSTFNITGADATEGDVNWVSTIGLQSVEEYRFDSFVSTAWMLAALRRTVEVAFVGGQTTPRVDRMPTTDIPGVAWDISIPFGVAAMDYRTMYLNYGA